MTSVEASGQAPATARSVRSAWQRIAGSAASAGALSQVAWRQGGGVVLAVALWWIVAVAGVLPEGSVPTPAQVLRDLIANHSYYLTNAAPTTVIALEGFAIAAALSVVFGALGSLTLLLQRSVSRIALAVYCLPLPALLPLIGSLVPAGQYTRITMAVLFSFFPMLVGVLAGLRSTPADTAAIVHCAGGGRLQILMRVGLRAALPNVFAGARIAAPGALLGALVAEFSGAQTGLGVALVVSQQKLQTAQIWGLALLATLIGGLMYAVITAIGRWLHVDPAEARPTSMNVRTGGLVSKLANLLTPPAALLVIWLALVRFGGASPLVFKAPDDVASYLLRGPAASAHRATLESDWLITMQHTALIFAIGMAAALLTSCVLVSVPALFRLCLPLLIASQCVPQIAFIPLLVAVCGRGGILIAVTGLLVVFFPAAIVIVTALEERSRSSIDLIAASGGGTWSILRFARIPGAALGIVNAAQLAIPLALFGALVAEWLVTGNGISEAMSTATVTFDYTRLWADVVVMTVTVVVLYAAFGWLHERARSRFTG